MANYFKGKKIWITGASSGIGEALAKALAEREALLLISGRRTDKLEELTQELLSAGAPKVDSLAFDLAKADECEEAIEKVIKLWQAPDILILNGGLSQRSLIRETGLPVYRTLMEVDYLANVQLCKAFLDHWSKNKGGQVVITSSLVGKFGTPYRSGYAAAKHALHGFFDTLRAETYPWLKVNIICPGFIRTKVSVNALTGDGSALGQMDQAQAKGLSAQAFTRKALGAIEQNKAEVYIAKKEKWGVYLKRYLPSLFRRLIRSAKVR